MPFLLTLLPGVKETPITTTFWFSKNELKSDHLCSLALMYLVYCMSGYSTRSEFPVGSANKEYIEVVQRAIVSAAGERL